MDYELPTGIRPVYRGTPPSGAASNKEIMERYERWAQEQAARKAANEAIATLPAKIEKLETELRKKREREEAKARSAAMKKRTAAESRRQIDKRWKKAMREPLAWKAALKALEKMPDDLAQSISPAEWGHAAYAQAGGKLNFEAWGAKLLDAVRKGQS